jgi:hypothetical protein
MTNHNPSSPSIVGMSGRGGPAKFAHGGAKVGHPTAQHSHSVRYALSLIRVVESDRRRAALSKPAATKSPVITARPIAVRTGSRTGTRRLIGLDKTMLIYVRQRFLTGWPSGTGSESELGFPSRPIPDRMATKNVQQENIFAASLPSGCPGVRLW